MIQTAIDSSLEQYFMDMIRRISTGSWHTSKISVCSLTVPLLKMYPRRQSELFQFVVSFLFFSDNFFFYRIFSEIAADPIPVVRQTVAKTISVSFFSCCYHHRSRFFPTHTHTHTHTPSYTFIYVYLSLLFSSTSIF